MGRPFARGRKPEPELTEDAFVDRAWQVLHWTRRNVRGVVAGFLILALLVAGAIYYRSYRSAVREQAAVEYHNLLGQLAAEEPAVVAERLHSFVVRFDGTPPAAEARLTLARVHLAMNRPDAALETLGPVASRPADRPLGHSARLLMARAHEAGGNLDAALETLSTLAERSPLPFQRRSARADRARLLVEAGRLAEAARTYEALVDDAAAADRPGEAAFYRLRLGEVRGLLAGGLPPAVPTDTAGGQPGGSASPPEPGP